MQERVRPEQRDNRYRDGRGIALVATLFLLLLLLGGVAVMAMAAWNENQLVEREENLTKSLYGAEAGIAFVENLVWNDYVATVGGNRGPIGAYQGWLSGAGFPPSAGLVNVPGGIPVVQLDGMTRINNLQYTRTDSVARTLMTIQAVGQDRFNNSRTVIEHLLMQGEEDTDVNFGILARNLECIFCHTEVDSAPRVFNVNPARFGTFERIRVGALGAMFNRDPDASNGLSFDSRIAGTLYTRGEITNKLSGAPMTQGEITAADLDAYQFDPATQYILQDAVGVPVQVDLSQAATSGGALETDANLYMDYPTVAAEQTDGILPDDLKPVFVDTDNDLLASPADVAARMADASSDVGLRSAGSISGGVLVNVPPGNTYNFGILPPVGNVATIDSAAGGVHTGNVIMVGSGAQPLVIDKTVVIQGDVILAGVVQGEGQLYVSGNIYIVGDLVYNNGATWGIAPNGQRNLLMLRAGGNILINDFLTPQRTYDPVNIGGPKRPVADAVAVIDDPNAIDTGDHRVAPGAGGALGWWSFAMEQLSYANRNEWTFTQQRLQKNNGTAGTMPGQVNNGAYDPTYRPRYLTMGPNDPVYVFALQAGAGVGQVGTYWNDTKLNWRGDVRPVNYLINEDVSRGDGNAFSVDGNGQMAVGGWSGNGVLDTEDVNGNGMLDPGEDTNFNGVLDTEDLNGNGVLDEGPILMLEATEVARQNAAVIQMTPNGGWISDQNLKSLWIADNAVRAAGTPITIDAGLHSDNAIMALSRNQSRYGRQAAGQLIVNGMLMGRTISILANGDGLTGSSPGFRLNYDPRLVAFNSGVVTNPVTVQRLAMEYP